jgi:hypothetical protein
MKNSIAVAMSLGCLIPGAAIAAKRGSPRY